MNKENQTLRCEDCFVYVGTYTDGNSEGNYICRLDTSTGELRQAGIARGVDNPSYLAIDALRHHLYTVNEVLGFDGRPGGAVSAYAIRPGSGELSLTNQQHSHGGAPCYLKIDSTGRYLLVANYMGGNVAVIPVDNDGFLREPTEIVTHFGRSLHPKRQDGPHPHSVVLDSANAFAFGPDLGLDKVMQYRFDQDNGRLFANLRPWIEVTAGSGPRHLAFHPNGRNAYVINELNSTIVINELNSTIVINELNSTITSYEYDPNRGVLKSNQMISTIPEGYSETNLAADLHLTPNGKFLIGSNQGHNSLAFYSVDQESGRLTLIDFVQTQGRTPRGFAIDPAGTFLLVANQDSHSVVTFRIYFDQGTILPTGHIAHIPSPVCLSLIA